MTTDLPDGWYFDPDAQRPAAVQRAGAVTGREALPLRMPPPDQDSFYTYDGDAPLPDIAPGTVLKSRQVPFHVLGVPTALRATQLLYRSTGQTGKATVNVTSVIQPLGQTGATKVLSYQSAYDSLSRNDQPSYAISGGLTFGGVIPNVEIVVFGPFLAQGFAVIVPDTEGQGAHFAAGPEYGTNTLDSIRAAFNAEGLGLSQDARVALLGYSGGAIASEWAAELAPRYAPDVDDRLIGAAIGGVLVHPAHNLRYIEGTPVWAGVMLMALIGIARAFDADFVRYLTPDGLALYRATESASIADVLGRRRYWGLTWSDLVISEFPTPQSLPLFVELSNQLIMGAGGAPTVPLFIGQGIRGEWELTPGDKPGIGAGDGVMIAGDVRTLARSYCDRGTAVQYEEYGWSHTSSIGPWLPAAMEWIKDRFAGRTAPQNCAFIEPGNPLDPLPMP